MRSTLEYKSLTAMTTTAGVSNNCWHLGHSSSGAMFLVSKPTLECIARTLSYAHWEWGRYKSVLMSIGIAWRTARDSAFMEHQSPVYV